MASELAEFGRRIEQITDDSAIDRILSKAGAAGKKAALDAAAKSLGGDRAFSGMRRRVALSAGYDTAGHEVTVNFRPAGLWRLAQAGRHASGPIRPRRGHRAVLTPAGPRARSSYRPSRGLGTFDDAASQAGRDVPKAAAEQFRAEVGRVVR